MKGIKGYCYSVHLNFKYYSWHRAPNLKGHADKIYVYKWLHFSWLNGLTNGSSITSSEQMNRRNYSTVLWVSKLALTSKESDLNPNTIGSKIQSCDVLLFNNSFESKFNAQSNLQC